MTPPQFPAGAFSAPGDYDDVARDRYIDQLRTVPQRARTAVSDLTESQLNLFYRNWTIRQIIHHLADSHIHCYVRYKWTLTEDHPTIKPYDETRWTDLQDAGELPVECSLRILEGVHERWAQLLLRLTNEQWNRSFFHPESQTVSTLREALPSYVWHSAHHLGQIAWIRDQNNL